MKTNFIELARQERDQLTVRLEALNTFLATYNEKAEVDAPAVKHHAGKKTRKQGECSNCGRPGHKKTTCPNVKTKVEEPADEEESDGIDRPGEEPDYNDVQALKERGLDQLRVAAKLHTTIGVIKKLWD